MFGRLLGTLLALIWGSEYISEHGVIRERIENDFFHLQLRFGRLMNLTDISFVAHHERIVAKLVVDYQIDQIQNCTLFIRDIREKNKILKKLSTNFAIEEVSFKTMLDIVKSCEDLQPGTHQYRSSITTNNNNKRNPNKNNRISLWTMFQGIAPGTKWCGVNDIAKNYHDLGTEFQLDKCCRAHDHCPIKIKAFNRNYGAINYHPYTKSHCACDDMFYDCLKSINSSHKEKIKSIGNIFFNVLNLQCIEPHYPKYCSESYDRDSGLLLRHVPPSMIQRRRRGKKSFFQIFDSPNSSLRKDDEHVEFDKSTQKCTKWEEDSYGIPKFSSVLPRRRY